MQKLTNLTSKDLEDLKNLYESVSIGDWFVDRSESGNLTLETIAVGYEKIPLQTRIAVFESYLNDDGSSDALFVMSAKASFEALLEMAGKYLKIGKLFDEFLFSKKKNPEQLGNELSNLLKK